MKKLLTILALSLLVSACATTNVSLDTGEKDVLLSSRLIEGDLSGSLVIPNTEVDK